MARPDLTIRLARPEEEQNLTALQRRASFAMEGFPPELRENPDIIRVESRQIADGLVFVAESEGNVLGFAALVMETDNITELEGLFVDPGHWRQGIGAALVSHACAFARAGGATRMFVVANPAARGFYETRGFVRTGERQLQFGYGIEMEKPI